MTVGGSRVEDIMRTPPTEATKQDSERLTETEATIVEPVWVLTWSSA